MKKRKLYLIGLVALLWTMFMAIPVMAKTTIKMSDSSLNLDVNMKYYLALVKWNGQSGTFIKDKNIIWNSSNKKVATVSAGNVKTKAVGKTTITAKYRGKTYKCVVTVKKYKKVVASYKTNVALTGKLKYIYGTHLGNGMEISNLIIQLSSPIHLVYKEDGTYDTMVKELTILAPKLNAQKYLGQKVQIKGNIRVGDTAWYLRNFAIDAKSIKSVK